MCLLIKCCKLLRMDSVEIFCSDFSYCVNSGCDTRFLSLHLDIPLRQEMKMSFFFFFFTFLLH